MSDYNNIFLQYSPLDEPL